jgi:hypothetical protein
MCRLLSRACMRPTPQNLPRIQEGKVCSFIRQHQDSSISLPYVNTDSSLQRPIQSSLPSPPNSSPSIDTFHLRDEQFLGHVHPTSNPSTSKVESEAGGGSAIENGPSMQPFYEDALRHFQLSSTPESGDLQAQHPDLSSPPTFASFNSPAATPRPVSIPPSPSFSSLVSKKRRLDFDVSEHEPTSRIKSLRSRSHPLSQSTSMESSTSQASVAKQLTQSLSDDDSESDEDALDDVHDLEQEIPKQSSKPVAAELNTDDPKEGELYEEELSWGSENSDETADPLAIFESPSQPPSQFQFDTFPLHHHGPKKHRPPPIETVPSSSAFLPLSAPAPLSSPTFAISTPTRQNWYQPVVRRKSSSKQSLHEPELDQEGTQMSPENSQLQSMNGASPASNSKLSSKKKSVFRSGTLHITPIALAPESPSPKEDEKSIQLEQVDPISHEIQDFPAALDTSQDYMDLDNSDSFDDFSYPPLQTQAPYESQTMSQL